MAILQYLPITQDDEIRLIDILPGRFIDILELRIFHVALNDADWPEFDALSYAWGSPTATVTVNIQTASSEVVSDGYNLFITQNLATALKHLRLLTSSRTIWADAICINQNDHAEKSKQVSMMGEIYRLSRKVLAFLGPEGDDSAYAVEILNRVAGMIILDFATGLVKPSAVSTTPEWADMNIEMPLGRRELVAIYELLGRSWFERLWIRQEIGLGNSRGELICGSQEIIWPFFCGAIYAVRRKPIAGDVFGDEQYHAFRDRIRKVDALAQGSFRSFKLSNLRRQIGSSLCSDQRDRIYGVLSQLRNLGGPGIKPDYTKTVTEVYTDATRNYIEGFLGDLEILSQCELGESQSHSPLELPSWVPDWSEHLLSSPIPEVLSPIFESIPAVADIDDHTLRAYGIRCAVVHSVVKLQEPPRDDKIHHTLGKIRKLLSEVCNNGLVWDAYASLGHLLEGCCRALWVNNFVDRWHPPLPHEAPYPDCVALARELIKPEVDTAKLLALPNAIRCLEKAYEASHGRTLFISEHGRVGLAPRSVAVGDEVCHLFGSAKPMVLRPVRPERLPSDHKYRVVGECYLHHMMQGEVVLGELPNQIHARLDVDDVDGLRIAGFMNEETMVMQKEDPRIASFLSTLVERDILTEPTLQNFEKTGAMNVLVKVGLRVQIFDLI
ncbi:MAG: hypothetical protein M1820_004539 [Bogoriella megaspora]|nr:MAG: hypothetical protein M1820_004539 [Bogoriella megaspora]